MNTSAASAGIAAAIVLLTAFTVPLAGPLRSSGAHLVVAAVVVIAGVILALAAWLPLGRNAAPAGES